MSWLYSQALVAAYSAANCLDGEPSAPLNGTTTPAMHLSHGKTTEALKLSRFGQTCKPLTDDHGAALLMSYLAAFPAKTSVPQEKAQASTANAQACGNTLLVLLARYDRATASLKTAQCSLLEDSTELSVTLSAWGMWDSTGVYLQPKSKRIMGVTESGLWQTPTSTQVPPRSAESWAKKQTDREATGRYTLPPGTLEEQVGISGVKPCWDYHKSPMNNVPDGVNHHTPNTSGMDGGSNSRKALAQRCNQEDLDYMKPRMVKTRKGDQMRYETSQEYWARQPLPARNERQLPWATPTTMDKLPPKSETALMREMTIARPGRSQPANLRDQVSNSHNWTTPSASDSQRGGCITENMTGSSLAQQVNTPSKFPTPMARDFHPRGGTDVQEDNGVWTATKKNGVRYGASLPEVIAKYPTPCSTDHKGAGQSGDLRDRLDYAVERGGTKSATFEKNAAGQLSPNWVEWLMGWPIGWTDLTATHLIQPDWANDPANLHADHPNYTPRVISKIPHRAARIKCIGNGQVPQCAATAFVILLDRLGVTHG